MYAMTRGRTYLKASDAWSAPSRSRCASHLDERHGADASYMDELNEHIRLYTSFTIDRFSPVPIAERKFHWIEERRVAGMAIPVSSAIRTRCWSGSLVS